MYIPTFWSKTCSSHRILCWICCYVMTLAFKFNTNYYTVLQFTNLILVRQAELPEPAVLLHWPSFPQASCSDEVRKSVWKSVLAIVLIGRSSYLENCNVLPGKYLASGLNDFCKQRQHLKMVFVHSPCLRSHIRPKRGTVPYSGSLDS